MKDIFSNWLHVHFSLDVIMLVILSISQSMIALMHAFGTEDVAMMGRH